MMLYEGFNNFSSNGSNGNQFITSLQGLYSNRKLNNSNSMNNNYSSQLVNCSMDEPLEVLMDRLSSKSSELYIFWVPHN